jgi:phosphoribosylformylglycinamidine synthase subunit PurL
VASKEWVYRQYDHMVRTNSVVVPGSDAAVVRLKHSQKALAMSVDCNGRYCYLDPRMGGRIAVAESARNCVCSGAKPLAITNCLNFGNPYKPEVYWTFAECVAGMGEACRSFDTPVTGGNVSFYNESPESAVYPTPSVGMIGLLEDVSKHLTQWFKNEGDVIVLLGETLDEIGGSEYLKVIHGQVKGMCPALDLEKEKALYACVLAAVDARLLASAHDCSEGGVAAALAECCITDRTHPVGAMIKLDTKLRIDRFLFSESQSRIVVSLEKKNIAALKALAEKNNVPFAEIGQVGGKSLAINKVIKIDLAKLDDAFFNSIRKLMES